MPLSTAQVDLIEKLLLRKIDAKLRNYARESTSMPFLVRLVQNAEHVASYSFIHSLATTLGMSIYEEVAKIVSSKSCEECFTKYDLGGVISREQKSAIDNILRELRNGERQGIIDQEIDEVLAASPTGGKPQKEGRIADFYMLRNNVEHYFEIKTVKPNIDVFAKSKSKLLEWVARRRKKIKVVLAFPYNPYDPEPYTRFTLQGMFTPNEDLLIGANFWDYLGEPMTYTEILQVFDKVGKSSRERINAKIKEVAETKLRI